MHPRFTHPLRPGVLLVVAAIILPGCAAQREARLTARESGPLVDDFGHHRSLSLDPPAMAELVGRQPQLLLSTPAYYDRLDRGVGVTA
ncbi:MAG: hypothetical protein AAFX76_06395, partial [Planctomycetota bacterium]